MQESLWEGHFSMSKDREVCKNITLCRCSGRRPVRLEEDEEMGRGQAEELRLCLEGKG